MFSHEFPPVGGGAGNALFNLAPQWASCGHRVTVLTSACAGLPTRQSEKGVDVRRIGVGRATFHQGRVHEMLCYMARTACRAGRLYREIRPDLCVAFMTIPGGMGPWVMNRRYRVPCVTEIRGGDVPGFDPRSLGFFHALTAGFARDVWKRSRSVIANGEGLARLARRTSPGLNVEVIPNGVDTEFFSPAAHDRGDEPLRLLYSGRLAETQKNLAVVIRALSRVSQVRLSVAGDGPDRKDLERLAAQVGAADRVHFLGWLDKRRLADTYRAADAYLSASRWEGMPNSVLEAMASGLALALSDIPGHRELVREGQNGFLFDAGNCDQVAAIFEKLRDDRRLCASLGQASRDLARSEFGWGKIAERHLRIFEAAALRPGG